MDEGCTGRLLLIVTDDRRSPIVTPEFVGAVTSTKTTGSVCCSKFGRLGRLGPLTMVTERSAMVIGFDTMVVDGVDKVAR